MEWYYFVIGPYFFIFGSCIASFINVVALRAPEGKSFNIGRPACPDSGVQLRAYDLIPIFSYLILGGKCRSCKQKISVRYPLTELAGGLLFVLAFWRYGLSYEALNACLLISLLLCVFLIDLSTMTIPNGLVLAFAAPCLFDLFLTGMEGIWSRVIGFFIISVPMLLLWYFIPGCFGGGDIKLIAVCGFLLGFEAALMAAFFGIVSCGLAAGFLLVTHRAKKGAHIAFGPYLAAGILAARFFYEPVIGFYLSLLR